MASERGDRKKILLRLDPLVHDALNRWAGDELRSTNAQIEFLLRRSLESAGRMPKGAGEIRRPGRPATAASTPVPSDDAKDNPRAEEEDAS
jgi:hypothetical protein